MKTPIRTVFACAALMAFSAAWAHHTFAMFDASKVLTLHGTVRELQWNNPHCSIQLLVADENGTNEWAVEMGSPMVLARVGWKPNSIKAGDKVTLVIHPLKDGGRGGSFMSATAEDGTALGKRAPQ